MLEDLLFCLILFLLDKQQVFVMLEEKLYRG
jgi:hypothetical protein